jgi:hypothetical protein
MRLFAVILLAIGVSARSNSGELESFLQSKGETPIESVRAGRALVQKEIDAMDNVVNQFNKWAEKQDMAMKEEQFETAKKVPIVPVAPKKGNSVLNMIRGAIGGIKAPAVKPKKIGKDDEKQLVDGFQRDYVDPVDMEEQIMVMDRPGKQQKKKRSGWFNF